MTREEAKQTILIKSKSYESAHQNYIHLLSLHKIIDDIFDEHEEELKQAYIDGSNSNNELIKFYLKRIEKLEKNA